VNCHRHQIWIFGWADEKVPAAGAAMDHTDPLMFGSGEVVPNPMPGQFGLLDLCYSMLLLCAAILPGREHSTVVTPGT
jgi:hypothetical protein